MWEDIKGEITASIKRYPFGKRVAFASLMCLVLVATTTKNWSFAPSSWHPEEWKVIAILAFSVACLFEPKGRWNLFFLGIGVGDVLLNVLS